MKPGEQSLRVCIAKAQKGDAHAFQEIHELVTPRVFAYTRARLQAREDALDSTQQVLIELWRSLPRFEYRSDPQFYAFLFTIVKRVLIRMYHNGKREPEPFDMERIADESEDGETADRISRALQNLSPLDRDIVVLHHWSRYTFGEIGSMLDLTESAVRVRHHRALKSLKDLLTHHES